MSCLISRTKTVIFLIPLALLGTAEAEDAWVTTRELSAPEAVQAAAADEQFVYAIASRQVAKYDRVTGRRLSISTGEAKHLNSGFLWDGKLLCAHSNYPQMPERSDIKILDPKSMRLSTFKQFGDVGGSLTWVVRYEDHWWCNFARYGDKNAETFFVKFDDDWRERGRWTYPETVIRQLGRYSLSGGLWRKHELLVTGHDNQEFYRLRLPQTGSVLEYLGKQSVPFTGQGFGQDPKSGGLVGISRARRRVIFVAQHADQANHSITHGPFVGHITSDSVLVWARCSQPGTYRLSARSDSGMEVQTEAESTTQRDGCVVWKLESLRPATRYRYAIQFRDETLVQGDGYYFTTAPTRRLATVRLAFASCAKEDEGSAAVWRRLQAADPHAVVLLGDTPYIDSTDLAVQRRRHGEFAAAASFRELVRNRSLYATWDDHDFGRNDTDGNLTGKENSRRAFMEYRANPSYGDGQTGIYTKFRRGGVEVFLLDTRYFAATEPSPFAQDRPTLLGAKQWNWLRRELKASTAPFKVLACGMIWNGAVRPGKKDHWGTYPHERDALFDLIGKEKITGVVLVGGDIHRTRVLRYETSGQVGYDTPELITSPTHGSVIASANVPHPALVHDSGEPNTFLLVTVDTKDDPATLNARFLNLDGRALFEIKYTREDLE